MAYKSTGTAGKSASGASMSKYDVEVEARLQKLEESVSKLLKDHEGCGTGDDASTAARLDVVIDKLNHQIGGF